MASLQGLNFLKTDVRVRYSIPWDIAQHAPGGATYETAQAGARAAFHKARETIIRSHNRSGALATSMRTDMDKRGSKVVRGMVRSNVEHAKWFFGGTNGPITPNGKYLRLQDPFPRGFPPNVYVRSVRGQANKEYILEQAAVYGLARVASGRGTPRGVQVRF